MNIISLHDNANRAGLSGPPAPVAATPSGPAAATATGSGGAGKLLGIWRLGELIHDGPHAQVWSAQPADCTGSPRWDYVLKTIRRDTAGPADREESVCQLVRFAEAADRARHPHLVAVLDAAPQGSEPFLVMPRLGGRAIADLLAQAATYPLPVVLWWIRQTAQATAALHAAGFIHGDIKPDNVLVSPQGHATLIDLGFAARIGQPGDGTFRGSVAYAAPECLQSDPPATAAASDVFSLGRLLWQLLSLTDQEPSGRASIDPVADLIAELVDPDPAIRPTAERLAAQLMRLEIETLGQHIRPAGRAAIRDAA